MEQLIELVAERAGIPEDKARIAVDVVISQLKDRLPAPMAAQVESALAGGDIGGLAKGLGGMFGKK